MIRFGREICGNLDEALQREWLETNGLGGFASSTIVGLNTRRYHGLLTAATKPPVGRMLLLSKIEETLVIQGRRYDLSANRYPGVVHPEGHQYLRAFKLDPFPVFRYQVEDIEIEKRVFLVHAENTVVVEYEASGLTPVCVLELRPLIAFRDYHATAHRNDSLNGQVQQSNGLATVAPYFGLPSLHFAHNASSIELSGHWYQDFEFEIERERGLDFREDLFQPFVAMYDVTGGSTATLIASTEHRAASDASALRVAEIRRREEVLVNAPSEEPLVKALTAAADQFIVKRGELKTIIAGYHWFSDWGRDTMISLPGLTLATGRSEIARSILLAFADHVDRGMLPNRFPDAGEEPEYNTVDATLWFFEAIRSLIQYTGDPAFVKEHLYERLKEIVSWHLRGTRYGIRVDVDGLLQSGEPGVQLTWMDAKIGDWVVTPRHGKPVEIQALWYNALRVLEELARGFGDREAEKSLGELASHARVSFQESFWNEEAGCLFDVIHGGERDESIRPNQIFAVSLAHTMLAPERAAEVVAVVQRELFTPLGLRTLAQGDPRYRPRYEGGVADRDASYHQGTVWPWLMGPFVTAYVKVHGGSEEARAQAGQWLEGFQAHLRIGALGQISEIADASAPHMLRGCAAQASSVAELLRVAIEDVYSRPSSGRRAEQAAG
jgi:predicted glycogen debranching enzyme